uniref:Uncharacterized protein n=1 Tax=Solanum lycopersicum TaxID=4081 RepID=A0A3Q7I5Z2_SOLLC
MQINLIVQNADVVDASFLAPYNFFLLVLKQCCQRLIWDTLSLEAQAKYLASLWLRFSVCKARRLSVKEEKKSASVYCKQRGGDMSFNVRLTPKIIPAWERRT